MRYLQNSYLSDLACLSIASALHLIGPPLGEPNAEKPQHVIISGLDIDMSLDKCLPLLNQRTELVRCKGHTLTR